MANSDDLKQINKLVLRNLELKDYDQVKTIMDRVYPTLGGWTIEEFSAHSPLFLKGRFASKMMAK